MSVHDSDIQDSYLLTPLQEGMLFDHEIAPGSGANIVQITGVLHEHVDPALLEKAWRSVVGRNPVLRTSFHWEGDGEPVQRVHAPAGSGVLHTDWSGIPAGEAAGQFESHLDTDRRNAFDPGAPPLARLAAFSMPAGETRLLLTLHHLILDGHAFPLLLGEMFAAYESLRGGSLPREEEPVPFRAYVDWLRRRDQGRSEGFWREYLAGFMEPIPILPEGGTRQPAGEFTAFGRRDLKLPPHVLSGLRDRAAESGVRLSTVFHAAWGILLGRYSGQDDVVFGETRACRRGTVEGAGRILGCCINTVPLRVRIDPGAALKDLLRQMHADRAAVRAHEQTPLGKIRG
jgi:hypothetical protein